jgi:F0F1-type ATP synthase membrane subunit c/vacuolar-type H+-ATPase subunit K
MVIVNACKVLVFGFAMFPVAFSALGVGILFAAFNLAVSRNPEEREGLFSNTMMAFALIESFVFIGLLVATAVSFLL